MSVLAVDWTAVGSVAGGLGAVAAFLAILATVAVYAFQRTGDQAGAIRRALQFLQGQQQQIVASVESGLLAVISRQTRAFQECLGEGARPGYFLDQVFGDASTAGGRALFRASALDSCLSSPAYARLSSVLDEMNMRAAEFHGALRVFSYACEILTEESRSLFMPEFTFSVLDAIAQRDRDALRKIRDLNKLVDTLLASQIEQADRQFADGHRDRIGQGCFFVGMLADMMLRLPDRQLLRLSRRNVRQPWTEELRTDPGQALGTLLRHVAPKVPERDMQGLRDVLRRWAPGQVGRAPELPDGTQFDRIF
jgi:hypothetical protein